jgi:hypothetical protein
MTGRPMFAERPRVLAAVRAAEALLQTLGGGEVLVRVPLIAPPPGISGELGLAGAVTEDIRLAPAVVRRLRLRNRQERNRHLTEVLIAPGSLTQAREIRDSASAKEFFESAVGLVIGEKLFRFQSFSADEYGGAPYLYRVIVSQ